MTLYDMAQEYRVNTRGLELRMLLLQRAQRLTRRQEVRFRLKGRIGTLRVLINESRKAVFEMEHYRDRGGETYADKRAV